MSKKNKVQPPAPREYLTTIQDSGNPNYVNRLLIGTASTGTVRIEWFMARNGQVIPTNWSKVEMIQFINSYIPLRYQVADAQNLIVKAAVEGKFEWLLLWEHDCVFPPDALMRFNQYMRDYKVPVVSGLYFTRSCPSEPILYRGRGNSFYTGWKRGDKVWVDGVPTGALLIHMSIINAMWDDLADQEYDLGGIKTRPVFATPNRVWEDPETGMFNMTGGTSDLEWCATVMQKGYFEKAGWPEYQKMQYPFLVDTGIWISHINPNGEQFPGMQYRGEFG